MGLYTYSMYEHVYAYVRKYICKVYLLYHIRESVILHKNITIIGSIGNTVSTPPHKLYCLSSTWSEGNSKRVPEFKKRRDR